MKILAVIMLTLAGIAAPGQQTRLENLHGKTVLVFTPHPDDDVFGAGGTIALLNRNQNKLYIVIYTNDDKGSYDLEMTSQHLAQIRKTEEEVSEGLLGTPKENIMWMGYDDGMLEYAPHPKLVEEATAIIRRIRPDVLLSVDPGEWYERWHKPTIAWRLLIPSMPCARRNSGSTFPISACNKACSHTRFRKCISSTLRRKKRITT